MLGLGSSLSTNQYRESQKRVMVFDGSTDHFIGPATGHGGAPFTYFLHDDLTSSKISISVWIKMDDLSSGTSAICSVFKKVDGAKEWYLIWNDSGNKLQFYCTADGTTSTAALSSSPTNSINDTNWHHVVVNYDGSEGVATNRCQMYIDGSAVTTSNSSSNPERIHVSSNDSSRFIVGATDKGTGIGLVGDYLFEGRMADLYLICNYVFTAANVTDFYNNGRPKNMKSYFSDTQSARRVYYRADNYLLGYNTSHCIHDSISRTFSYSIGLGSELVDLDKRWTGDTTSWEALGSNAVAQDTTAAELEGLPSSGHNGESITGAVKVTINSITAVAQRLLHGDWLIGIVPLVSWVYRISFWAKSDSAGTTFIFGLHGDGGASSMDTAGTTWKEFSAFVSVLDTSLTNPGIYLLGTNIGEILHLTGFSIKVVSGYPLINGSSAGWGLSNVPSVQLPLDRVKV